MVCINGPAEQSEGKSVEWHERVVLKASILSEQLKGEDMPNFAEIFENQQDIDVADDTPFYCATEALFDPIALSVVAYPDMTLFQNEANDVVKRLDAEVLSAITINNGSVRINNSLCVNKATMLTMWSKFKQHMIETHNCMSKLGKPASKMLILQCCNIFCKK